MTVTINTQFDCTQREFVADLAWKIYRFQGYRAPLPLENVNYFFDSQHSKERTCLAIAEDFFEMLTGDSPSYDDDPEDET